MKLVSWNVNGIRAVDRKGLFQPMLDELQPDIICLQETKAEQSQSPLNLSEYEEYWSSAEKKGYSGTAIFTKTKPKDVLIGFPETITKKYELKDAYGDLTKEGRVIAAEFDDFYVVTVYTPNSKSDLSRLSLRHKHWDPAFLTYVKQLEKKKPVMFSGDLNVAHTEGDLARPKDNEGEHGFTKEEREGADNIVRAGYVDAFRLFHEGNGHYTWWSPFRKARERGIGWRIDYWFVSEKLKSKVKTCDIHDQIMGSDHCPVSLELTA